MTTLIETNKLANIRHLASTAIATLLVSPSVYAEHNGGSDGGDSPIANANCNASFKSCAYAAPWPTRGSDPVEIGLLAIVLCAFLLGKRMQKKRRLMQTYKTCTSHPPFSRR